MKLSLYLCTSFLILIEFSGKSLQFNAEDTCPTSRRLLLFGGFQFPFGEKKSEPVSSPAATKHSRTTRKDEHHHGLTIYIQPQTSSELGHKVRSFSHLLKPKVEKAKKKIEKKLPKKTKKKKIETKVRDLISVNDQELDRCRALLHLEPANSLVPLKPKDKKTKTKAKPKEKVKEKKKKTSEKPSVPLTPPKVNAEKKSTPPPPPPPTPSPPPPVRVNEPIDPEEPEIDENGTVVGRAYHFMKSMFQLSDDILESNQSEPLNPSVDQTRSSRKLLSFDHLSHVATRHLLTVKTAKKGSSKPKVGWEYRYRISKYLADQKSRQKRSGGGKSKGKTNVSKRKLLQVDLDRLAALPSEERIAPMSVSITEMFVPKRQLLSRRHVKEVEEVEEEDEDEEAQEDDDDDEEKVSRRREMKSYEELTDPVAIVQSYERGLFKPRVGWQFRYRVSRYIDSLRANIREDQERLKLGLQAIKRKTPQELSGRRKRVLDKPFQPESEAPAAVDENKPTVGWRYRYRVSKMLDAKARGEYVDEQELKRKAKVDQKKKGGRDDDECLEWEFEQDPELRKIGEEGRKVGWAYRYRIRRKLEHLQQRQAETGIPFDWETLGAPGKREKKRSTAATSSTTAATVEGDEEKVAESQKKTVGWQYRYRVSKMLEAQKQQTADQAKKKKSETVPLDARLDPELAKLTGEQRVVGWAYRYRIRRKLEAIKNATKEANAGKRKKKMIKQVEESIEKILNIDDIDETPFMEYFRRTSSYVLFGLVPTAKKSVCLLPLPVTFSFCQDDDEEPRVTSTSTSSPTGSAKTATKKEKVKKEKRVATSTTRPSKAEPVVTTTPTPPVTKKPKKSNNNNVRRVPPAAGNSRRYSNEQVKHFDEEEEPIKRRIGVASPKHKTKKKFQIIGQEVKAKPRVATTTAAPVEPVTTTPPPPPPTTTTTRPPPPPTTTTTRPPPPPPTTTTTPAPPPVIPEEEASNILSSVETSVEETKEEIKENLVERPATPVTEDDDDEDSETDDQSSSGSESDDEEETEQSKENFDPLALKKMKKLLQNAKNTMHGVFEIAEEKDSP